MNRKSQKKSFFCHRRKGGHGGGLSSNGALPWRKWRLRPSRRPWLVSPIALTRLRPPEQPPLFADRLAQLTPTSREAERAAIAHALGLDVPAPVRAGADREPLRDNASRVRTVLCARSVLEVLGGICRRPALKTITRSHVCTFVHSDIRDILRTRWCVECSWSKGMLTPAYSALCTYGHDVIIVAMAPSGARDRAAASAAAAASCASPACARERAIARAHVRARCERRRDKKPRERRSGRNDDPTPRATVSERSPRTRLRLLEDSVPPRSQRVVSSRSRAPRRAP